MRAVWKDKEETKTEEKAEAEEIVTDKCGGKKKGSLRTKKSRKKLNRLTKKAKKSKKSKSMMLKN